MNLAFPCVRFGFLEDYHKIFTLLVSDARDLLTTFTDQLTATLKERENIKKFTQNTENLYHTS